MATNLSNYFREQRIQRGLRPGQVARLMGYKSVVGAANKIILFEERGDIQTELFRKLAVALEIDEAQSNGSSSRIAESLSRNGTNGRTSR